jgi:hypothetical protein
MGNDGPTLETADKLHNMATVPTTAAVPQNRTPRTATETVELVSKLAASLLFSVYVFGFLITSLHTSVYGFTTINPLRPRILAAGTWFLIFTGIPTMIALGVRKDIFGLVERREWLSLGLWVPSYYFFCFMLGAGSTQLFDFPPSAPPNTLTTSDKFEAVDLLILLVVAVVIIALAPRAIKLGAVAILAGLIFYGAFSTAFKLPRGGFDFFNVTAWFFCLGLWVLLESRVQRDAQHWVMTLFLAFILLGGFARYYYPRIKSSWGGGSPIPVVLYLSKDASVASGKQIQALLLDETDAGYYIVPAHENKAIFLPRSAVGLVLFGDKISDSLLLRTGVP